MVLQAIDQASLLVDNESQYVTAGRGVLIYVSFVKNAEGAAEITTEVMDRAVETVLQTKIFTHFCPERMVTGPQALVDHPHVDIMIVPQASLGGKPKGRAMQFHQLLPKDKSEEAYDEFCHRIRLARGVDEETVDVNGARLPETLKKRPNVTGETEDGRPWLKYDGRVVCGTFGNRQGLRMDSDGPFSHYLEIA